MERFIYQNCSPEQRKQLLEQNAQGKEKLTYMRNLTEAEIETESKKLAGLCKERNEIEQEKADMNKTYSDRIKDVKTRIDNHTKILIDGEKEESATCYKFINIDTREVGFYDAHGELVRTRPAMDSDLQLDMFHRAPEHQQPVGELPPVQEAPQQQALPLGDPNEDIEEAVVVEDEEEVTDGEDGTDTEQESEEEEDEQPWYNR